MSDTIHSYRLRLEKALRAKTSFTEPNTDIHHAVAIVTGAFKYAGDEILILSGNLDERLYCTDRKISLMRDFFARGGSVRILVEETLPPGHRIREMAKEHPGNLSVKLVPVEHQLEANFMLVDNFGLRLEMDKKARKAFVSFHHPDAQEIMERLTAIFNELSGKSAALLP